jgi:hypothetical protein
LLFQVFRNRHVNNLVLNKEISFLTKSVYLRNLVFKII